MSVCKEVQVLVGLFAIVTERSSTGRFGVIATAPPIAVKLTHINGVSPTSKSLLVGRQHCICEQRMMLADISGEFPLTSAGSMLHMSGVGAETLAVVTHGQLGSGVNWGR